MNKDFGTIWELLDSGNTRRLHTHKIIKEQTIAEHSWGVAVLLMKVLYKDFEEISLEKLLKVAILHDCAESVIGDIPYFTKRSIGDKLNKLEDEVNIRLGINEILLSLNEKEKLLFEIVDLLELGHKCFQESNLGNSTLHTITDNVTKLVDEKLKMNILPEEIQDKLSTFNFNLNPQF